MDRFHIYNVNIINEGKIFNGEIFISNGLIEKINHNSSSSTPTSYQKIDGQGNYLIPGIIDSHVHFREPGYIDKATIASESLAALYGGVTSFIDMPNTLPPTTNKKTLEHKLIIARDKSFINYGFFLTAVENNILDLQQINPTQIAGIKIFWGDTTGGLNLIDTEIINEVFKLPFLIAVHSEDNATIQYNESLYLGSFKNDVYIHPIIRGLDACIIAAKDILGLASKYQTRLHYLHVSHINELNFILQWRDQIKHLSIETCPHYLYFDLSHYDVFGNLIKVNPSIKSTPEQRIQLLNSLNIIDTIASDHAPHLKHEKQKNYDLAPSGLPSIQHNLGLMWNLVNQGYLSLPDLIEKMTHNPAKIFKIKNRGYIREGYYADLVLVDDKVKETISTEKLKYKCGWSPYENFTLPISIKKVWVNGNLILDDGKLNDIKSAQALIFENY
ncbi:MAG: amidohydrolase family protein [Bacteroidales bacterium]|jgi:dihydroorotase|nr:amidohydrolase family protein [Bacteroidales bacterium]MDI9576444.1 amidohydrolase family protein [Bacteroidota bacterium]MDD3755407.1 amidohydrolase family protein [Bacteroidales bacterium]MDY0400389.1 amidohydrolase family protein [Bacteroidales bacterium]HHW58890.1 amidohydrolase family protein [Bacteroidales bacterium]